MRLLLLIIRKKVMYAIGNSTMPNTLVGTANQNLASASPHKKRKPNAPVMPGRMEPILCFIPPISAPSISVTAKPLISIRMMIVEMAMPSTPIPKTVCESAFLPVNSSSESASWKASRLISMAAIFLSASFGSMEAASPPLALKASRFLLKAPSKSLVASFAREGSRSPLLKSPWNWWALAITTQVVARKNGRNRPSDRSNEAKPRCSLPQPLRSMEYGSRNVMLMPTAVAAAATMRSRWESRMTPFQYSGLLDSAMNAWYFAAGSVIRLRLGMKPAKISPHFSSPAITMTTPKKLSTTIATITLRMISKIFTPLLPLSYDHTTTTPMTNKSNAQMYLPLSPSRMPKFC